MDPFISRADLGNYLRRDLSTDAMALIAVDAACGQVRDSTGQLLDRVVDETILLDGKGSDTLLLPELPVVSVTSVTLTSTAFVYSITDDYWVDTRFGTLVKRGGGVWGTGRKIYTVVYTHGYTEVPEALRVLALTAAARIYDQGLVKQESVGGYQAVYAASESLGFSARELQIIAKYRRGGG